jgi:hypothetical protein
MYSTCIFCHSALGANEAVEHFPVGRRLAFDADRGRLWVVCRKCERWNLSPLEERWEAIEECERLFSSTKLRVSTDNIGLARIREGLELVRIGAPQRPEMAAWRYGDQFGRRRKRHLVYTGVGVAAGVGIIAIGPATGIIAGSSWGLWNVMTSAKSVYDHRRARARLMLPDFDEPVNIRLKQLNRVSIVQQDDSWALRVPFESPPALPTFRRAIRALIPSSWTTGTEETTLITGDAALRAAGKLLPAINVQGAKRDEVHAAVNLIEEAQDPASLFARYAGQGYGRLRRRVSSATGDGHTLANLPKEVRLALEMATHEESERRALEGELSLLETAWQEAEEIAAISDDLFVPDDTRTKLADLKRGDAGA